jgi:hypothetical protein
MSQEDRFASSLKIWRLLSRADMAPLVSGKDLSPVGTFECRLDEKDLEKVEILRRTMENVQNTPQVS